MISEDELARIGEMLDDLAGLDALWLFGSEAAGRATVDSDVDLAALFARTPDPGALAALRDALSESFRRPFDVVDLEQASPVLAMQVLKHGRLVARANERHRIRFTAALPGRYEDVSILRRPGERLLRARLGDGGA